VPLREDQPRRAHVEREPEQRGEQERRREHDYFAAHI
jgi:hypothetical protein